MLAKNAGFCYGVKRAVESTKRLKESCPEKQVSVLGELIHNSHVILELEEHGIKTLSSLPEKGEGICVIRSHGESEEVFREVQKRGYELLDLTCEDVKKVQSKAISVAKDDYFVIILGIPKHPEVVAIYKNAKAKAKNPENIIVISKVEELKSIKEKLSSISRAAIVLQTTQTKEFLFEVVDYLSSFVRVIRVENTICPSTTLRQNEARELAQKSDLMVVVGSKKSANTTHLAQILKPVTKTIHIEDEKELDDFKDIIQSSQNIGVTAGASTPDTIIDKVIEKLNNI